MLALRLYGGSFKVKKYIKSDLSEIRYFEDDVNAEDWIDLNKFRVMTDEEIDRHESPEKYLSDNEKALLNRERMPTLTPIEFDIKLIDAGLYDQVQGLIQSDVKLKIAYTRATFFSRTDPFIDQARIALSLTDEQVDTIWESSRVQQFYYSGVRYARELK